MRPAATPPLKNREPGSTVALAVTSTLTRPSGFPSERRWAFIILERVAANLKREYTASDKGAVFDALHPFLSAEPDPGAYADAAATLGTSESALRVALHRLRRRFGEMLRREIGRTVSSPAEVDDEIRHLFAAVGE